MYTTEVERFREMFDANYQPLVAYARRRVTSAADADDIVGETFAIAWRRRDRVPEGDAARLYLYGVARRVLANQRRATARRRALIGALRPETPVLAEAALQDPAIEQAFRALREDDREILRLVAWEGLQHAEVAEVLGTSVTTASGRLRRARARLRRELERAGAERTISLPGDQRGQVGTRKGVRRATTEVNR